MKIPLLCSECARSAVKAGHDPSEQLLHVSPSDTGAYEVHCPKGHVTHAVLEQLRFELLFEVGAYAIRDGYFREAISSFASSLERFVELYIKISCNAENVDAAAVAGTWKMVSNQSERQLGAYCFLYAMREKSVAPYLSSKMVELRNSVIHKGKLASRIDAITFGNAVLAIINPVFRLLKTRDQTQLNEMVADHIQQAVASTVGSVGSSVFFPTILSVTRDAALPDMTDIGAWSCTDSWQQ